MTKRITVTVGPDRADFMGDTHRAIQSAVDYVSSFGGGTVEVLPGTYRMGNAVHLRSHVRLTGHGDATVLLKNPSRTTTLVDDTTWYDSFAIVEDPSCFEVGGGILLRAKCEVGGRRANVSKHTVVAIDGNVIHLDSQPRKNMWITHEATASTLYPVVTGNDVTDIAIENMTIDGNREHNDPLDGNYGGCIFIQDCERVHVSGVVARNNGGDGISWQVCHDVVVEHCESVGHLGLGLHPGSGSQRPVIRHNRIADCRTGLFWCWGVKHGIAEYNEIRGSSDYGISIGYRDTDNLMRCNRVYDSGKAGLYFRPEPHPNRCPHRNRIESNLFHGAGTSDAAGVGIDVGGEVDSVALRYNCIVNPPGGHMTAGIRVGEKVTGLTIEGNRIVGVECEVDDPRDA